MNFIDKLEQFLLRPRAKVYYNTNRHSNGLRAFHLGSFRRNYGQQDKEIKNAGIVAMMKKLRDHNYQDPDYDLFSLDLIGWDYFDDILKLEPSDSDLFNLYQITGYRDNKLSTIIDVIKDKDLKIELFKLGQDYSYNSKSGTLYDTTAYLTDLSDEQWVEALGAYIHNSPRVMEKEGVNALIEVSISCIKDSEQCEKFIKDFFHRDINLSKLFVEKKVNQLKIESTSMIKKFGFADNSDINTCFLALVKLIEENVDDFNGKIDFYQTSTEYNFISDDESFEIIKDLINQLMPDFNLFLYDGSEKKMFIRPHNIAEYFQDKFLTILRHKKLSSELPDKEITSKVSKI